jgi:2'-5' RNA ligase
MKAGFKKVMVMKLFNKEKQKKYMRLFVAVDLEEPVRQKIAELIGSFRRQDFDVKWVETGNLHITLKFLGEVGEEVVKDIAWRVEQALESVHTFRISIEGLGYFGSPNFIRVLWTGVKVGENKMNGLIMKMKGALDDVKKDSYPPNAHVTIGRVRSGKKTDGLMKEIEKMKHVKFGEMDVKFIKLKQSILGKGGPYYSDLKVFELK